MRNLRNPRKLIKVGTELAYLTIVIQSLFILLGVYTGVRLIYFLLFKKPKKVTTQHINQQQDEHPEYENGVIIEYEHPVDTQSDRLHIINTQQNKNPVKKKYCTDV